MTETRLARTAFALRTLLAALVLLLFAGPARAQGIAEFLSQLPTNGKYSKGWDWQYQDQRTVTWQKGDGEFQTMSPDGVVSDTREGIMQTYSNSGSWNASVWGADVQSAAGDRLAVETLGTHGAAGFRAGMSDGEYSAQAEFYAAGYLVKLEASTRQVDLGDATLGLQTQASGDAFVGALVEGQASANASLKGVEARVNAEFFAGGRAEGQIPLTVSLCYMQGSGKVQGQVSYGIGGEAIGTFEVDWASMKAKVSGQLAATLGLGAGAGAEVEVDLSALVKNPGKVMDCLVDKLQDLGEAALAVGGSLVDAAKYAVSNPGDAAVAALSSGLDLAKAAVTASPAGMLLKLGGFLGGKVSTGCGR